MTLDPGQKQLAQKKLASVNVCFVLKVLTIDIEIFDNASSYQSNAIAGSVCRPAPSDSTKSARFTGWPRVCF